MEKKQKFQKKEKFNSAAFFKTKVLWKAKAWQLLIVTSLTTAHALALDANSTNAQITPDTTLGNESSKVTSQEAVETINGGAARGANLFHSFSEFNVKEGSSAYFVNPPGIDNIITRVTGANFSNILGTLGVKGGNANLFFLNPNGIIFGANARLDIGGSFIGSTANNLKFVDGKEFSTTGSQSTALLSISVPIGLGFGTSSGSIRVQGNGLGRRQAFNNPNATENLIDTSVGLQVQPNQTLALVANDLEMEGATLSSVGGRIELGSVAPSSTITLAPVEKGWGLDYDNVQNFQDIKFFQQTIVNSSGIGAGEIYIRGRQVKLAGDSLIEASTLGDLNGGIISITSSDLLELTELSEDTKFVTAIAAQVYPKATGNSGNIIINTGRLFLRDGAQINTTTNGKGSSGSLNVSARDFVELIGTTGNLFSALLNSVNVGATGNSGNLTIDTGKLIVRDGAQIFTGTYGKGSSGSLNVSARDSVELIGRLSNRYGSALSTLVGTGATGNGGNLNLATKKLIIRDGAVISSSTQGQGIAGSLTIKASNSVQLLGKSSSGISSTLSAQTKGFANAGNINIGVVGK